MNNPLETIDYELLREQKLQLLLTIDDIPYRLEQKEALEGILHLIDSIQDYAVNNLGVPSSKVYTKGE